MQLDGIIIITFETVLNEELKDAIPSIPNFLWFVFKHYNETYFTDFLLRSSETMFQSCSQQIVIHHILTLWPILFILFNVNCLFYFLCLPRKHET